MSTALIDRVAAHLRMPVLLGVLLGALAAASPAAAADGVLGSMCPEPPAPAAGRPVVTTFFGPFILAAQGGTAADTLTAAASSEREYVNGGAGNDLLCSGTGGGVRLLVGAGGNDTLVSLESQTPVMFVGGPGWDRMYMTWSDIAICGTGYDTVVYTPEPSLGGNGGPMRNQIASDCERVIIDTTGELGGPYRRTPRLY